MYDEHIINEVQGYFSLNILLFYIENWCK
jgi:hypothetical protein